MSRHPVGAALGAGEHQRTPDRIVAEQRRQQCRLLARRDVDHPLVDEFDGRRDRRHRDFHRVVQQVGGELTDVGWHRCREQKRLAARRRGGDDAPDRQDEAHVEHPVDLVEDNHLDPVEADVALLHVVEQPAGGGGQHVDAAGHLTNLRGGADAAENDGRRNADAAAIGANRVVDLARQFAGGCQHQHAAAAARRRAALCVQAVQDRQRECRRLAGAGLGDAEQVAPGEDVGDGLRLDRRRRGVALGGQHLQDGRREAEV